MELPFDVISYLKDICLLIGTRELEMVGLIIELSIGNGNIYFTFKGYAFLNDKRTLTLTLCDGYRGNDLSSPVIALFFRRNRSIPALLTLM